MKLIFVGRRRPYPDKNNRMVYGAYFAQPNDEDPDCVDILRVGSTAKLDGTLAQAEQGTELDVELVPRMFGGKVDGMNLVGING